MESGEQRPTEVAPGVHSAPAARQGSPTAERDPNVSSDAMTAAPSPTPGNGSAAVPLTTLQGEIVPSVAVGSDDDLAQMFADANKRRLRYVDEWGTWHLYDGHRWVKLPMPKVWNEICDLSRKYAANWLGKGGEGARRDMLSRKKIAAAEALARGRSGIIIGADVWDADPWLLNTPNGVVDLRTGILGPNAPEAYCTKMTAVPPGGDCPRWRQFLAEITGGDRDLQAYLQRLVGYCLIGQVVEHVLVFLYGTGGNGKGVFLGTIRDVLADYAKAAPADMFTETRNDRHPTELAMLRGARLVTAQETDEGRAWDEAKIKALTGGDQVVARFMRGDFFEFTPQLTLIIAGNHKPRLRNVTEAIRRRIHMVPFTVRIDKPDDGLRDKLRAEWPGILQWAIEGCLAWGRDRLSPPEAVRVETDEYLVSQDPLGGWIPDCCIVGSTAKAAHAELYASYANYAEREGETAVGPKQFTGLLESKGFRRGKVANNRGFYGIGLRAGRYRSDTCYPFRAV